MSSTRKDYASTPWVAIGAARGQMPSRNMPAPTTQTAAVTIAQAQLPGVKPLALASRCQQRLGDVPVVLTPDEPVDAAPAGD